MNDLGILNFVGAHHRARNSCHEVCGLNCFDDVRLETLFVFARKQFEDSIRPSLMIAQLSVELLSAAAQPSIALQTSRQAANWRQSTAENTNKIKTHLRLRFTSHTFNTPAKSDIKIPRQNFCA